MNSGCSLHCGLAAYGLSVNTLKFKSLLKSACNSNFGTNELTASRS